MFHDRGRDMEKEYVDITFFRPKLTKGARSEFEVCSLRFHVGVRVCAQMRIIVIMRDRIHKLPLRRETLVIDFIEKQRCRLISESITQFVRSCFYKALDREIRCEQFVSDAQTYIEMEVSELSTLYTQGLYEVTSVSVDVPTSPPSLLCYRASLPIKATKFLRAPI